MESRRCPDTFVSHSLQPRQTGICVRRGRTSATSPRVCFSKAPPIKTATPAISSRCDLYDKQPGRYIKPEVSVMSALGRDPVIYTLVALWKMIGGTVFNKWPRTRCSRWEVAVICGNIRYCNTAMFHCIMELCSTSGM